MSRMKALVRGLVWWLGLDGMVEDMVKIAQVPAGIAVGSEGTTAAMELADLPMVLVTY